MNILQTLAVMKDFYHSSAKKLNIMKVLSIGTGKPLGNSVDLNHTAVWSDLQNLAFSKMYKNYLSPIKHPGGVAFWEGGGGHYLESKYLW